MESDNPSPDPDRLLELARRFAGIDAFDAGAAEEFVNLWEELGPKLDGYVSPSEEPPAFQAARNDDVDLVRFIAICGPVPEDVTCNGKNLAFATAEAGNLMKLEWLINRGVDPDARDAHGYSPLLSATNWCRDRHLPVIRYLLGHGVDVEARSTYGETPLLNLLRNGRFDAALMLLDAGANAEGCGFTPLHHSAAWGDSAELADRIGVGVDLEVRDLWDRTPWLVAVHAGRIEAARQLAAAGASVQVVGRSGDTPLHLAAMANRVEMVNELVARDYDINATNGFGGSPLHDAAAYDAIEAAAALLEAGAALHGTNQVGSCPVNSARSLRMLELLSRHGADLNHVDGCGEWPLKSFAEDGDCEAVRWLLDHGAQMDRTSTGATALHYAICRNHLSVAARLLERGADVNRQDVDQETPLCYCRSVEAAEFLLSRGADPSITDQGGYLPDDWEHKPAEVRAVVRRHRDG